MSKHTPGTWDFEAEAGEGVFVHDEQGTIAEICCDQTRVNDATAIANARLIAAAPELLETLQALFNWGRDYTSPTDANSPHALLVRAHEVISKATEGK